MRPMLSTTPRVAVIGGGPAGATAAAGLAEAGVPTVLFHVNGPHGDKPCGGGVTSRAFLQDPALAKSLRIVLAGNDVHRIALISPAGREVVLEAPDEPFFTIYARGALDGALRERAVGHGAVLEERAVRDVRVRDGAAIVTTDAGEDRFDWLIGADGAFSKVRRSLARATPRRLLCPAVDELVDGIDPRSGVVIAFFRDVTGYLWVFPRNDLASVGLVAREGELRGDRMRARVREFLARRYPAARLVRSMGWSIPAPGPGGDLDGEPAGERFLLVGDAAGLADPISGEGISYAIRSGALAARAIAEGSPARYTDLVREHLRPELECASRWVARYFRPRVLEALLMVAKRSRRTRAILGDLISGRQGYPDLGVRLRRELGPVGWILRRL